MMCLTVTKIHNITFGRLAERTSQTVSFTANGTLKMDLKDQGNSINWISLINTVFASIAVLPVFLVWFLGIITDSIEEKETQEDKVIIIEDNEEMEESKFDTEERHLYVIPNLRNDSNLLKYQDYCTYQDCHATKFSEGVIADPDDENVEQIANIDEQSADKENKEVEVAKPFNWPADSDVIEHLRRKQNQQAEISLELRTKLNQTGILRQNTRSQADLSRGKVVHQARISGKSFSKKQVHVFWDDFMFQSRPGLLQEDYSPNQSPSPKSRKPLKKINLEKANNLESRLRTKIINNVESQNNALVRAF